MTPTELLAICASNVYSHEDQSTDIAISIAQELIQAAEQATAFQPAVSPADRERANAEDRARMVRRAVQKSRPAAEPVSDEELPF